MPQHIINGVKINTHHDCPPIPVRDMDWSAVTDDYDITDTYEDGTPYSNCPCGHGATEQAAIDDLLEQLADQDPAPHEPFPDGSWWG